MSSQEAAQKDTKLDGLKIRFRVSGPAGDFTPASNVPGGGETGAGGTLGLNVLIHGDGGRSFFQMPNQGVKDNLAGVAILAPDENLRWGGGNNLTRPNGVAHAQAINDLIIQILPKYLSFNISNVYITSVSAGSLLVSGFFIPAHIGNFAGNGVMLGCGAWVPQVEVTKESQAALTNTPIHYQSTQSEEKILQTLIPDAIKAYAQVARDKGLKDFEIDRLQTADNTPKGGHCEFDGRGFDSGVQMIIDDYSDFMQGGGGTVPGIGNVLKGVASNKLIYPE
ncbi:hypothetical protein LX36DRAFT_707864 [Colletotrichum falcatum]|nr:hypothetical protein LX36DRAFT_707864 [Colletotrichum falcatum]